MTKTPADALLPVTQSDRDAAASFTRNPIYRRAILAGERDAGERVQAFTAYRHRLASLTPPPGEDQAAEGALAPDQLVDIVREAWGNPVIASDMEGAVELLVAYERHRKHPATPEKAAERGDLLREEAYSAGRKVLRGEGNGTYAEAEDAIQTLMFALAQPAVLTPPPTTAQERADLLTDIQTCADRGTGLTLDAEDVRVLAGVLAGAQGWRMVPVEPTDEMQLALMAYPRQLGFSAAYSAMLAAAPAAPLSTAPAPSLGTSGREDEA